MRVLIYDMHDILLAGMDTQEQNVSGTSYFRDRKQHLWSWCGPTLECQQIRLCQAVKECILRNPSTARLLVLQVADHASQCTGQVRSGEGRVIGPPPLLVFLNSSGRDPKVMSLSTRLMTQQPRRLV